MQYKKNIYVCKSSGQVCFILGFIICVLLMNWISGVQLRDHSIWHRSLSASFGEVKVCFKVVEFQLNCSKAWTTQFFGSYYLKPDFSYHISYLEKEPHQWKFV